MQYLSHASHVSVNSCVDAAKTYFNSVLGTSRLKSSGKYDAKVARQRRKNRLMRVCYTTVLWGGGGGGGGERQVGFVILCVGGGEVQPMRYLFFCFPGIPYGV